MLEVNQDSSCNCNGDQLSRYGDQLSRYGGLSCNSNADLSHNGGLSCNNNADLSRNGGLNRNGDPNRNSNGELSCNGGLNRNGGLSCNSNAELSRNGGLSCNNNADLSRNGGLNRNGGLSCNSNGELSRNGELSCNSNAELSRNGGLSCNSNGELSRNGELSCNSNAELSRNGGLNHNGGLSCNSNGELSRNGELSCNSNAELSRNGGLNRNGGLSYNSNGELSRNGGLNRNGGLSCNCNGAGLPVAGAGMSEETKSKGNGNGAGREESNPRGILTESQVKELEKYCSQRLSASVSDPAMLYPQTPGFQPDVNVYNAFRLQHSDGAPITPDERRRALDLAHAFYTKTRETYLGYQVDMHEEYAASLSQYLNMHINNVGDPFSEGTFKPHSKFMERAVLDYFASLWRARWPHEGGSADSYWGYVLSMGASEGNLYGMWNGREYLAGKVMLSDNIKSGYHVKATVDGVDAPRAQRSFTPIFFCSKDTHYSLKKCTTVLNIKSFHEEGSVLFPESCPRLPNRTKKSWPRSVPSNPDGSIDIAALAILVEFFVKRGYPILVSFNYGTTFKGAYDDVEAAGEILMPILQKHGMYKRNIHFLHKGERTTVSRNGFWFHVDGALGAAYLPFIEAAYESKLVEKRGPNFDFRLPFVHSICVSGHKWIGAPVPCGIYMSKSKYRILPPEIPMYTGTPDTTLSGSRGGLAAMFLWDFLSRNSMPQLVHRAIRCEQTAQFLQDGLKRVERRLNADLYVSRSPLSLSVLFKRPCDQIVHKYTLSTETRSEKSFAHAFAMAHVSFDLITRFCNDLLCHGYPDELQTLKKRNPKAYEEIVTLLGDPSHNLSFH